MSGTTHFLLCVYVAAILLQGYVAVSYLMAAWAKTASSLEVAALQGDPQPLLGHQTLTFDAIEPASGK